MFLAWLMVGASVIRRILSGEQWRAEAKKDLQKKGRSSPAWVGGTLDLILILTCVWHGMVVTGVILTVGWFFEAACFYKPDAPTIPEKSKDSN